MERSLRQVDQLSTGHKKQPWNIEPGNYLERLEIIF